SPDESLPKSLEKKKKPETSSEAAKQRSNKQHVEKAAISKRFGSTKESEKRLMGKLNIATAAA
ncbi:hypothetical protein Tco_0510961, partial [Tanacetum coccineum]